MGTRVAGGIFRTIAETNCSNCSISVRELRWNRHIHLQIGALSLLSALARWQLIEHAVILAPAPKFNRIKSEKE
jgi:hypothetical protein